MLDLIKHAEGIKRRLAGIAGVTVPEFSSTKYFGDAPQPVTPANVIANRVAGMMPAAPAAPQPFSLLQGSRAKSDIAFSSMNDRTTRLAGDTRPLPSGPLEDENNALVAKIAARNGNIVAAPAAGAAPNVLANRVDPTARTKAEQDKINANVNVANERYTQSTMLAGRFAPSAPGAFDPGGSLYNAPSQRLPQPTGRMGRTQVEDNPALNVLERRQQLAQIGAQ